jgi:hypothetical protein
VGTWCLTDGSNSALHSGRDATRAPAPTGQRAGRSIVATAVVHANDLVDDRAKVSDHIGDDGCLVEGGDNAPDVVIARDEQ